MTKDEILQRDFLYGPEYDENRRRIAEMLRDGQIEVRLDWNRVSWSLEQDCIIYRITPKVPRYESHLSARINT